MRLRTLRSILSFFLPVAYATTTNRTIDDTAGDLITGVKPIYVPSPWQGPDCGGCKVKPPLDQVFMQTYSALTYWPEDWPVQSIQFSFQGTAVYVYFILANFVADQVTTETFCNFTLDGQFVTTFHHIPTQSTDYQFNYLAFSKDGLSNTEHTLLISTSGIDRHLFTSFDYAHYTFDDSVTSSISTTSSSGAASPTAASTPSSTATFTPSSTQSTTQSSTQSTDRVSTSTSLSVAGSQAPPSSVVSQTTSAVQSASSSSTPSSTPNTSTLPVATIVGGAIGGLLIFLVALLAFLCYRRRRQAVLSSTRLVISNELFHVGGLPPLPSRPGTAITSWSSTTPFNYFAGLPPPPPYFNNPPSEAESSDTVQTRRQAEVNAAIQALSVELQGLTEVESSLKEQPAPSSLSFSLRRLRREKETVPFAQLHHRMDEIRGQIKYLKTQLQSDWARGLSDEPPPSYSVIVVPERY